MNPKENTLLYEIADKMDVFENTIMQMQIECRKDKEEIKALKTLIAVLQTRQAKLEAYFFKEQQKQSKSDGG